MPVLVVWQPPLRKLRQRPLLPLLGAGVPMTTAMLVTMALAAVWVQAAAQAPVAARVLRQLRQGLGHPGLLWCGTSLCSWKALVTWMTWMTWRGLTSVTRRRRLHRDMQRDTGWPWCCACQASATAVGRVMQCHRCDRRFRVAYEPTSTVT